MWDWGCEVWDVGWVMGGVGSGIEDWFEPHTCFTSINPPTSATLPCAAAARSNAPTPSLVGARTWAASRPEIWDSKSKDLGDPGSDPGSDPGIGMRDQRSGI